jgi:ribosomal protein S24E
MTTLEVNTSKKNLFTELFSKENRLLLHKHIINKLKLSDISKESKKNILNILQKNMKTNYTNLFTRKTAKSNGYGKILEKVGNSIRLYPYLVEEFKVYF